MPWYRYNGIKLKLNCGHWNRDFSNRSWDVYSTCMGTSNKLGSVHCWGDYTVHASHNANIVYSPIIPCPAAAYPRISFSSSSWSRESTTCRAAMQILLHSEVKKVPWSLRFAVHQVKAIVVSSISPIVEQRPPSNLWFSTPWNATSANSVICLVTLEGMRCLSLLGNGECQACYKLPNLGYTNGGTLMQEQVGCTVAEWVSW